VSGQKKSSRAVDHSKQVSLLIGKIDLLSHFLVCYHPYIDVMCISPSVRLADYPY